MSWRVHVLQHGGSAARRWQEPSDGGHLGRRCKLLKCISCNDKLRQYSQCRLNLLLLPGMGAEASSRGFAASVIRAFWPMANEADFNGGNAADLSATESLAQSHPPSWASTSLWSSSVCLSDPCSFFDWVEASDSASLLLLQHSADSRDSCHCQ